MFVNLLVLAEAIEAKKAVMMRVESRRSNIIIICRLI